MHWTTILLKRYKEALVAFDKDYVTGYHFLRENHLLSGMCIFLEYNNLSSEIINTYIRDYVYTRTNRLVYLTEIPHVINAIKPGNTEAVTQTIKTRIQHLHKMREELEITEPFKP